MPFEQRRSTPQSAMFLERDGIINVEVVCETESLVLMRSDPDLAIPVSAYYKRNRDFLAAYEPLREDEFYTPDYQEQLLRKERRQAADHTDHHFWIAVKGGNGVIVGSVALTSIIRGAFQSCYIGYKLDQALINRGYMTQAVKKCVETGFNDIGLHRIEANVMPRNAASLRVAEKAGFVYEGLSRKYLKINGCWEDHIHMVVLNPDR